MKLSALECTQVAGDRAVPSSVSVCSKLCLPSVGRLEKDLPPGSLCSLRKRDAEGLEALKPEQSLLVSLCSLLIRR